MICANQTPDHATIARFRARHEAALADTFTQVLALCAKAGLASVGLVALDGTLVAGNAAPGASRSYRAIADEILGEAARADADEDERLGEARGDELPAELPSPSSRRARLARCKEQLEAEEAAEQAGYEANLAWRAQWEAEHGRKLAGRKPTPPDPDALERRTINTTDPHTRRLARRGGTAVQGYNVQVLASPEQVILATEVTQAPNDSGQLAPMVAEARAEIAAAGIGQRIGFVVADGGYWSAPAIAEVRSSGIEVLVPTANLHRTAPRKLARRQGEEARRVEQVLASPEGAALYRRRQQIVEPVFAQTKFLGAWVAFSAGGWRPAAPSGS